jgi:hypothetical protein
VKLSSVPFWVVFGCCLTPMMGALVNVATLHVAAGFVLGCWIISMLLGAHISQISIPRYQLVLLLLMSSLLLIQASTGRGFVVLIGGFYVLALSFVFYQMLKAGIGASLDAIVRSVSLLNKFFVVGLVVEFIIIVLGGQIFLSELFATTEALAYRLTAQADIPRMLGIFDRQGGLNSLLLGPQISGMLALFALIWFLGIKRLDPKGSLEKNRRIWVCVSALMYLACLNGTVAAMTLLAILMYGLFINRRIVLPVTVGLIALVGIVYILIVNNLLFERIFSGGRAFVPQEHLEKVPEYLQIQGADTLDFYIFAFTLPFTIYNFIDWTDILLGVGAEAARTDYVFLGSDLGFFVDVVVKSGAIWAVLFVMAMLFICFPSLSLPGRTERNLEFARWRILASLNAFLCVLWLASTAHYNQALTNSGGAMVFALHLALVMYSAMRAKSFRSASSKWLIGNDSSSKGHASRWSAQAIR